jgi:hypothetical protein
MSIIKRNGIGGPSWTLRAFPLLIFVILAATSGCRGSQKVWSAEARSPDGKMIATAQGLANGGFGISGVPSTFVYLNWATGSQKPTEILCLDDESDTPEDTKVGMEWLSPTHLELTYEGSHQSINFQAVKFAGIVISVSDQSHGQTRPSQ